MPDGINTDSAGYDYVVFVGSLEPSKAAEQIRAAKRCLVSGGELIIAACNPFGLKYWAGARADDHGFSKKTLETLLGTDGETSWYYPMPDIKVPVTIFSDEYLPGRGELSDNRRNFDRDRLQLFDEKKVFDTVLAEGLFGELANSFWIEAGNRTGEQRVIYSKAVCHPHGYLQESGWRKKCQKICTLSGRKRAYLSYGEVIRKIVIVLCGQ